MNRFMGHWTTAFIAISLLMVGFSIYQHKWLYALTGTTTLIITIIFMITYLHDTKPSRLLSTILFLVVLIKTGEVIYYFIHQEFGVGIVGISVIGLAVVSGFDANDVKESMKGS